MKRKLMLALGALVVLYVVFALGRWSARETNVTVAARAKETVAAAATSTRLATETATATAAAETDRREAEVVARDRWYRPDGSLEREREVKASQLAERKTEQTAGHVQRAEHATKVETVEVVREVEKRVEVQADAPRWLIGGMAGIGLDGVPVYGPQVHYRVAGPLHVSGGVLFGGSTPVAHVGLGLSFQ